MKGKKDTSGFVKKNIILLIVVLAGILLLVFSAYYTKLGTASEQRAYRLLSDSAEAQRVAIDERVSASLHYRGGDRLERGHIQRPGSCFKA